MRDRPLKKNSFFAFSLITTQLTFRKVDVDGDVKITHDGIPIVLR